MTREHKPSDHDHKAGKNAPSTPTRPTNQNRQAPNAPARENPTRQRIVPDQTGFAPHNHQGVNTLFAAHQAPSTPPPRERNTRQAPQAPTKAKGPKR